MDSKQKYANLEKQAVKVRRSSRSCIVALLVYNALILTAAGVAMAFMVWRSHYNIRSLWDSSESTQPMTPQTETGMMLYDVYVDDMYESVGIDTEAEVEMVTTEYFGTQVTTYLDFKKSMGTFFVAEWGECYMVGGLDSRFIQPTDLVNYLGDSDEHHVSAPAETVAYEKAADYPIMDTSLLPPAMRADCLDKPLFWLRQINAKSAGWPSRDKRAVSGRLGDNYHVCIGVCITVGRAGQA